MEFCAESVDYNMICRKNSVLGIICLDLRDEKKEVTEVWPAAADLNYCSHSLHMHVLCACEMPL